MDIVFGAINFAPLNPSQGASLYRNISERGGKHWIELKLKGKRGGREAIGASIEVWTAGVRQLRQVTTGGSFISQTTLTQHFGLDDAATIDSILIFWPGGGRARLVGVAADQILSVEEASSTVRAAQKLAGEALAKGTLSFEPSDVARVYDVYDAIGKLVRHGVLSPYVRALDLNSLPPGFYSIAIGTERLRFLR
jgi:hypothetical protein